MNGNGVGGAGAIEPTGRGLHSSTFQLNVSAFCGIGVAWRVCLGVIMRVIFRRCRGDVGGSWGCTGCISCQIRLRFSLKVDECKPLPTGPGDTGAHATLMTPVPLGRGASLCLPRAREREVDAAVVRYG